MYPYDFRARQKGINPTEIFVVMPFDDSFNVIFDDLIKPAAAKANELLGLSGNALLKAYRSKDDIRTASGWLNVLEHLNSAQIVLGVLTGNNPNVFYELGIAHATQPIARQILIAEKEYSPTFDTKDLIFYRYGTDFANHVQPLGEKIKDAIDWYKIEEDRKFKEAIMQLGPYEFEAIMLHAGNRNFTLHTGREHRNNYENALAQTHGEDFAKGSFERHVPAISNLCRIGLIGLDTYSEEKQGAVNIQFSYHWTHLGNCVLRSMKLLPDSEVIQRRQNMPAYFR